MEKKFKNSLESQLLIDNIGLVVAQARNFKPGRVTDIDDYKQAGAIALLKAIRNYDPTKGKLGTFAWKAISREIVREATKFQETVTLTEDIYQEEKESIFDFIPNLSEDDFEILWLRICGHSLEEIGNKIGESKQNINHKLKKIISIIKECNEKAQKNIDGK
jgi:RNA polymerase sigma factor (sigma-70 family)